MAVDVTITRGYKNPNFFSTLNPQSGYGYYRGGIAGGGSSVTAHNQLQGLQGGGGTTPSSYYHFTLDEWHYLTNLVDQMTLDSALTRVTSIATDDLILDGNIYFDNIGDSSLVHTERFIYWGDTGDQDTYIHEYTDDVLRIVADSSLITTFEKTLITASVSVLISANLGVTGDVEIGGNLSFDSAITVDEIESTLTNNANAVPLSSAVFAAISAEDIWDRTSDGVITPATSTDPILLFSNIYFENNVTTSHLSRYIYWGDPTDGWDTYIYESADDVLKIFAGGTEVITFAGGGITLLTGATVNTIETTLTDDDTHIPTSGAVFAYAATIAHTHRLDEVTNPNTGKTFTMSLNQLRFLWTAPVTADGALELEVTGAFTGDVLHIHQHTGAPGAGTHLVHLEAANTDVMPLYVDAAGTISAEFTKAIKTDTINEFNTDAGVTIESLKIEDGTLYTTITDMTFQDGSVGPYTLTQLAAGAGYWDLSSAGLLTPLSAGDVEIDGNFYINTHSGDSSGHVGRSIYFGDDGDWDTSIGELWGDDALVFMLGGTQTMYLSSVGVGLFNAVTVSANIYIDTNVSDSAGHTPRYIYWGDAVDGWDTYIYEADDDDLRIYAGGVLAIQFASTGIYNRLTNYYSGLGTPVYATRNDGDMSFQHVINSDTASHATKVSFHHYGTPSSAAESSPSDAEIFYLRGFLYDGASELEVARILVTGTGAVSAGSVSGQIRFSTRETTGALTEQMRIHQSGSVYMYNLTNDEVETNVVAYDTVTGLLTYRSVASIGGGGYWDRSSAGVLSPTTSGDDVELDGGIYLDNNVSGSAGFKSRSIYWGESGDWDTYIHEAGDDNLQFVAGGSLMLSLTAATGIHFNTPTYFWDNPYIDGNVYLNTHSADSSGHVARAIYWGDDGDWDTTIIETADDELFFYVGGSQVLALYNTNILSYLPFYQQQNFFFDTNVSESAGHEARYIYWGDAADGWDTYIGEPSDDLLNFVVGGQTPLQIAPTSVYHYAPSSYSPNTENAISIWRVDGYSGIVYRVNSDSDWHNAIISAYRYGSYSSTYEIPPANAQIFMLRGMIYDGSTALEVARYELNSYGTASAGSASGYHTWYTRDTTGSLTAYMQLGPTGILKIDDITEYTGALGVTIESLKIEDGTLYTTVTDMTFQDGSVGPYTLTELYGGGASYWDRSSAGTLTPNTAGDNLYLGDSSQFLMRHTGGSNDLVLYPDASDITHFQGGIGYTYFDTASVNNLVRVYDNDLGANYYITITGSNIESWYNGALINQWSSTGIYTNETINVDTINEATGDVGVTIEGITSIDSYMTFPQIPPPAGTPSTNEGYLFMDSNDDHIKWKNNTTTFDLTDTSNIWDVSSAGVISPYSPGDDLEIDGGTLTVDIINEYTNSAGVTIEGVKFEDNTIVASADTYLYNDWYIYSNTADNEHYTRSYRYGGTEGAPAVVPTGADIYQHMFYANDGTSNILAGTFRMETVNAISTNVVEGRMYFTVRDAGSGGTYTSMELFGGALQINTIIEQTTSSGVTIEGIQHIDSYFIIPEITAPAGTPAVDEGYMYMDSTDDRLYFKNNAGTYNLTLGEVGITGSPFAGMVTFWTSALEISGSAKVTWNDPTFDIAETLAVDTISEHTIGSGVTIDGLTIKDSNIGTSTSYEGIAYLTGVYHRVDSAYIYDRSYQYSNTVAHAFYNMHYRYGGTLAVPAATPTAAVIYMERGYVYDGTSTLEIVRMAMDLDGAVATDNVAGEFTWSLRPSGIAESLTDYMNLSEDGLKIDTIIENTASAGVTVETVKFEDGEMEVHRNLYSYWDYYNYSNTAANTHYTRHYRYGGTEAAPAAAPTNAQVYQALYYAFDGASDLTPFEIGYFRMDINGTVAEDNIAGEMIWRVRDGAATYTYMRLANGAFLTNTINEYTAAAGVTIEGVRIEDSTLVTAAADMTFTDGTGGPYTLAQLAAGGGGYWDRSSAGVLSPNTSGDTIIIDAINEETTDAGVTIESVRLENGTIYVYDTYNTPYDFRTDSNMILYHYVYNNTDSTYHQSRSYRYGGTQASPTAAPTNAWLRQINNYVYDGTTALEVARISFRVDGAISTGSASGYMQFSTRETTGAMTERLRIGPGGEIYMYDLAIDDTEDYVVGYNASTGLLCYMSIPSSGLGGGGSGGGITWDNGASNRVGTYVDASSINAEANLTFDGSTLTVTGTINANDRIFVDRDVHGTEGLDIEVDGPSVTTNTTNNDRGATIDLRQAYDITSGYTDSGYRMGMNVTAAVNDAGFIGNLDEQFGIRIQYGSLSSSGAGTITDTYGLYLEYTNTGSATLTNSYSIYSTGAATMYHAGNVEIVGEIETGGNVGIGMAVAATYELSVGGSDVQVQFKSTVGNADLYLTGYDTTDYARLFFGYTGAVTVSEIQFVNTTGDFSFINNSNTGIIINGSGYIFLPGIQTSSETVTARYTASGGEVTYPTSDASLKTNIVSFQMDALSILSLFQPKHFEWKKELGRVRAGWIAQEGVQYIPDMFPYLEKAEIYGIAEFEILPYFHVAINQLNERQETQEEKIIRLEKRVDELESQLLN